MGGGAAAGAGSAQWIGRPARQGALPGPRAGGCAPQGRGLACAAWRAGSGLEGSAGSARACAAGAPSGPCSSQARNAHPVGAHPGNWTGLTCRGPCSERPDLSVGTPPERERVAHDRVSLWPSVALRPGTPEGYRGRGVGGNGTEAGQRAGPARRCQPHPRCWTSD